MVTNWKIIAQRVSNNLGIPIEEVEKHIDIYASQLKEGLTNGEALEYDYFYIAKMTHLPNRLTSYWTNLKKYPDRRNYEYIKKCIEMRKKFGDKKERQKVRAKNNKWHRDKYPEHY